MSEENREYWERILSDLKIRYELIIQELEGEIQRMRESQQTPYVGVF